MFTFTLTKVWVGYAYVFLFTSIFIATSIYEPACSIGEGFASPLLKMARPLIYITNCYEVTICYFVMRAGTFTLRRGNNLLPRISRVVIVAVGYFTLLLLFTLLDLFTLLLL